MSYKSDEQKLKEKYIGYCRKREALLPFDLKLTMRKKLGIIALDSKIQMSVLRRYLRELGIALEERKISKIRK